MPPIPPLSLPSPNRLDLIQNCLIPSAPSRFDPQISLDTTAFIPVRDVPAVSRVVRFPVLWQPHRLSCTRVTLGTSAKLNPQSPAGLRKEHGAQYPRRGALCAGPWLSRSGSPRASVQWASLWLAALLSRSNMLFVGSAGSAGYDRPRVSGRWTEFW